MKEDDNEKERDMNLIRG